MVLLCCYTVLIGVVGRLWLLWYPKAQRLDVYGGSCDNGALNYKSITPDKNS